MTKRNRQTVRLTSEQRERHAQAIREVDSQRAALTREALRHRAERDAMIRAFQALKAERQRRGMSLADVSDVSGIDRSYLSKLENDPAPNPTFSTLVRYADAVGGRIDVIFKPAA